MKIGLLERKRHGPELSTKWIQHQPEAFEGRGAKHRIVARFPNDDERVPTPAFIFERGGGESSPNDLAVGEHELAGRVRSDAELVENAAGDKRVDGTRINKAAHLRCAVTVSRVAHLDLDERQPHG